MGLKPKDETSIPAAVTYINPAGSAVKVDMIDDHGQSIQAEISQDEFNNLKINKGDRVYISLRQVTFLEYEI